MKRSSRRLHARREKIGKKTASVMERPLLEMERQNKSGKKERIQEEKARDKKRGKKGGVTKNQNSFGGTIPATCRRHKR